MPTLAIIHTTPATVASLKKLALESVPDLTIINFMDDSILPQLAKNQGYLADVEERLLAYARYAEQAGADIILEACSSVGEITKKMRLVVKIPVVRIDEAMAEWVVKQSENIGVVATLATTLQPTMQLLLEKADTLERKVLLSPTLVEGAFQRIMDGDQAGHDALLIDAFSSLVDKVDVIVLAQASMAGVVAKLPEEKQQKFFSSPAFAMQQLREILQIKSAFEGAEKD
jgi:aspartate/glutamate racemase